MGKYAQFTMAVVVTDENGRIFYDKRYLDISAVQTIKTWNYNKSSYDISTISYQMQNCSLDPNINQTNPQDENTSTEITLNQTELARQRIKFYLCPKNLS